MSAERLNKPLFQPASEDRRSWLSNVFECDHCGGQVCILYPVGLDPVAEGVSCTFCDRTHFSDSDGIKRDWRRLH